MDIDLKKIMEKHKVNGLSFCVYESYKEICRKSIGWCDAKRQRDIRDNTLFQVASISKVYAAWGVMALHEKGLIGLDECINQYLKIWKLESKKFSPDRVTVSSLLGHTGGINVPYYVGNSKEYTGNTLDSITGKTDKRTRISIVEEPGAKFIYSGGGYTLLQLLIEESTGRKFEEYMKEIIFEPLKMESSTFFQLELDERYTRNFDSFGKEIIQYKFAEKAAAGMYSSIQDMSLFINENLQAYNMEKAYSVLKNESVFKIHSRVERAIGYGYGIAIMNVSGYKILYHSGTNIGSNAFFLMIPKLGNAVCVLTNSSNGMNVIHEIIDYLLNKWLGITDKTILEKMGIKKYPQIVIKSWEKIISFRK